MAGKKCRGRQNNSHNQGYVRYKSEKRREKNKERKQKAHQRRMNRQLERSDIREELLAKTLSKLKVNTYQLKRLIGTPNIKRLTDIVEDKYLDAQWYLDRKKREQEKKDAKNKVTTHNQSNSPSRKAKGDKRSNKGVPSRRDRRNRKIQMAKKRES